MKTISAKRNHGFVVAYVLFALTIMSLTIAAYARMRNGADNGVQMERVKDTLIQQADLIRSKLIVCATSFPNADNGSGFHPTYPATPASGLVKDLACPGQGTVAGNLWKGGDGIYEPPSIIELNGWHYINDATSVRITNSASSSYPPVLAGFTNAGKSIGPQASISSGSITVTITN